MKTKKNLISTRIILSLCTITLLVILLCYPKPSLVGAENGILLWFNVIMPTLLPFIIVSNLIVGLHLTNVFAKIFHPVLSRLLGVSKHGSYVTVIGLITGLPVGAKACADLVREDMISKEEGQYLLTFCNNASPMFIISFISITSLNLPGKRYIFLLLIYGCAILTGMLYRFQHNIKKGSYNARPFSKNELSSQSVEKNSLPHRQVSFALVDHAIMNGFDILTRVGGYIVLFSIISNVLFSIIPSDSIFSYFTVGFIEITNGVNSISCSMLPLTIKIALILSLTAFGGLSSVAQTKSVIDGSGLSIRTYLYYKLINAGITFVVVSLYLKLCSL